MERSFQTTERFDPMALSFALLFRLLTTRLTPLVDLVISVRFHDVSDVLFRINLLFFVGKKENDVSFHEKLLLYYELEDMSDYSEE